MRVSIPIVCNTVLYLPLVYAQCLPYGDYAKTPHHPLSHGRLQLPYQRPVPFCRTFTSPEVEATIERMKGVIKDPDLYQLFQNTWPNTLDTTITWRGHANGTDEELAFVTTGDITAMWLRDSAKQLHSYLSVLKANSSSDSLAGLWRGVINLQARYIIEAPYCNAFQAPEESGIKTYSNMGTDQVTPYYDAHKVFSCDYELDSLASFLQLSTEYAEATGDYHFFNKYHWGSAVKAVLRVVNEMQTPTYGDDGSVLVSPYTFTVMTRFGGAPINGGKGSPVANGTGLIRSFFRPSDDACIFQFLIPSNMMFSRYLGTAANIMLKLDHPVQAKRMTDLSTSVRKAIFEHAVVHDRKYGKIFAYEIDGYGSTNMMDDANTPSLLSIPIYGFLDASDTTYQNTRMKILSADSPYFARGPAISAVGGPHTGPGMAWPMSSIIRILTSDDDGEIVDCLRGLLTTTDGLGLIHESIDSQDADSWSRHWFAWANSLFGQMILDLEQRKPHILKMSFQQPI